MRGRCQGPRCPNAPRKWTLSCSVARAATRACTQFARARAPTTTRRGRSAPSHYPLYATGRAYELYIARHAVRLFAPRSSPGWRTAKICPNFAFRPPYSVFAMTSRTTTCCQNAQGGMVTPRSRVPLYITLRSHFPGSRKIFDLLSSSPARR